MLRPDQISEIVRLRRTGHSVPEIARMIAVSKSTVMRYTVSVPVDSEYIQTWHTKGHNSVFRAEQAWLKARDAAQKMMSDPNTYSALLTIACLYWAEGSKKEFTFSNSDPEMIGLVACCLEKLDVKPERFTISIRIFEDMAVRQQEIVEYWAQLLGVTARDITKVTILQGKKQGKLKYGMCRIRLKKGAPYFKLIQSAIEIVKRNNISPHSSMDRAADS